MATACPEDLDALLTDFAGRVSSYDGGVVPSDTAELGEILAFGVALAITIDMVDANWRLSVLSGGDTDDPDQEGEIRRYYREWFRGAGGVVMHLGRLEAGGASVRWSDQFRRAYSEARGVLTPDDQFFAGDAMVRLRDEAIDAHRAGRTEPHHGPGQN